ncbi:MAG: ATP-binding cassette domain-containing protein [Actinomycetaceae bacterium]|nr:ATP-binding cassette domain-containing protein [Actinomycetaceae bacterium]
MTADNHANHAPEAKVILKNVTKTYPLRGGNEVHALEQVNLEITAGSIHGIVGQSGAGKSTLIRCLTALERVSEGQVLVDGVNLTGLRHTQLRQARRKMGMVFQSANLLDARTAIENVAYPLTLAGVDKKQRRATAQRMLDIVGLGDRAHSYPSQLSGGQRQRVGIARALAHNPAVLLCDEPTSALDAESTRQILSLLKQVRDELGVTVIIITHEMSVVREICDAVTMLEAGKVVETGAIRDIVAKPSSRLAQELVPMPALPANTNEDVVILDTMFTSRPGIPTGATVLSLASRMGADVAAGTFETIADVQVGRLALAVPAYHVDAIVKTLRENDIETQVRK